MIAFVRDVGAEPERGEKPQGQSVSIHAKTLRKQHGRLVKWLKESGVAVETFAALSGVEAISRVGDVALLLPETAIIGRANVAVPVSEVESILSLLGQHRPVQSIVDPGTLDAGDVLRIGRTLYVAESPRTNADGIAQLRDIAVAHGYGLRTVQLADGHSLRSACSFIPPHFLLVNPAWIEPGAFENVIVHAVCEDEPGAANTLSVGRTTAINASAPKTERRLNDAGITTTRLDISEFTKMGARLSSLVLLLEPRTPAHPASEVGVMPVQTSEVPLADQNSSPAVVHSGLVFTSAVLPFDLRGRTQRMSVEEQTEHMIRNLATVLAASGSSLGRIVRTTLHVADPKHVARIDSVWSRLFGQHRPARAIVANGALPAGVLVSIEAVAAQRDRAS